MVPGLANRRTRRPSSAVVWAASATLVAGAPVLLQRPWFGTDAQSAHVVAVLLLAGLAGVRGLGTD